MSVYTVAEAHNGVEITALGGNVTAGTYSLYGLKKYKNYVNIGDIMATLEELTTEATAEINAAKPLYKQVNNERLEFY